MGCISPEGIYTNLLQKQSPKEWVAEVDNTTGITAEPDSCCSLGSEEDLRTVSSNPLQRASYCLNRALRLSSGNHLEENFDVAECHDNVPLLNKDRGFNADTTCFEMALVSLAYIKLQWKDFVGALRICQHPAFPRAGSSTDCDVLSKDPNSVAVLKTTPIRLREMAEMYYREAITHAADT